MTMLKALAIEARRRVHRHRPHGRHDFEAELANLKAIVER
jgi:hypothetical protein